MRGSTDRQVTTLSTLTSDSLIPLDHPIRRIKPVVEAVLAELGPGVRRHVCGDGTLLEAWASRKSFRSKGGGRRGPPGLGRNVEVEYHGERRSNETHQSTTDPEARLTRKGNGVDAKLSYAGHLLWRTAAH